MCSYEEIVEKIFSYTSFGVKPGIDRIKELMRRLGGADDKMKFIHIAGTNGKGSTATLISSALRKSGYRTGLFTSPHLVSFCERISVDGIPVAEDEVVALSERVTAAADRMEERVTAFDVITAMALLYFAEKNCDTVVLECGLGGRYDATNIVTPLVSILTSISLDHKGVLGDTVEEIAKEKCGIIKKGIPVVSYPFEKGICVFNPQPEEVAKTIEEISCMRHSELVLPSVKAVTAFETGIDGTRVDIDGISLFSPLSGEHQGANMLTAYTALKEMRKSLPRISEESILSGFSCAYIPGRLEKVSSKPLIIIDGGHNYDCARAAARFVSSCRCGGKKLILTGMMKDKECDRVMAELLPLFDRVVITRPRGTRAKDVPELKELALKYNDSVEICENPCDAFRLILSKCGEKDMLTVFGSFYLAGEIKENFFS